MSAPFIFSFSKCCTRSIIFHRKCQSQVTEIYIASQRGPMIAQNVFQIVFWHSYRVGVGGNHIKKRCCVKKTATHWKHVKECHHGSSFLQLSEITKAQPSTGLWNIFIGTDLGNQNFGFFQFIIHLDWLVTFLQNYDTRAYLIYSFYRIYRILQKTKEHFQNTNRTIYWWHYGHSFIGSFFKLKNSETNLRLHCFPRNVVICGLWCTFSSM